jgi:hypothetical protein
MRAAGQHPMVLPRPVRRRIVHTGWLCQVVRFRNRPRPGLLGYRAGSRWCLPRAEQGPHDLSGLAGRGVAPLVAERADEVQSAAGLVEGAGRRGPIRDPRRAPAWRSAAARPSARGRDPVMAATCRLPGRPSPRLASASGSRCQTPGRTAALPSLPGQCHRVGRTSVCTFCDHQVLAGLTALARHRRAAAASSPGPDRIEDQAA